MRLLQLLLISCILFSCQAIYAQQQFKVVEKSTEGWKSIYQLVDRKGQIIRTLDTATYYTCFTMDAYVYFAIFGKKGEKNWVALDARENVLFHVHNTSYGEPSPDYLVENKIRIVDSSGRIGFANNKGQIVIKPQFEAASPFQKGKAIIGQTCEKIPWGHQGEDSGCEHYSLVCKKYGYINLKGQVEKIGDYSYEQVKKELKWKDPEY